MKSVKTTEIDESDFELDFGELTADDDTFCVGMFGGPGAGKSRLIASAPGKNIGLLATETKAKRTVLHDAPLFGKRVILPKIKGKEVSLVRAANPAMIAALPKTCIVVGDKDHKNWTPGQIQDKMQDIADTIKVTSDPPECCQRHYYRWHVNRVKHFGYMMLEDDRITSIGIDTFGTLVNDISYANYGLTGVIDSKEFGFAPREDMVKECHEFLNAMTAKNLILTHHAKAVWKNNTPTNKMEQDGKFKALGHYATVMLEMVRDKDKGDNEEGRFVMNVIDCQANPRLVGREALLQDDMITFQSLAAYVYPDGDLDRWE